MGIDERSNGDDDDVKLCETLTDEGDMTPACPIDDASGRQAAFIGYISGGQVALRKAQETKAT